MDTYEKKYKEALERAEKALEVFGTDKCEGARQIFSLFPELKESEDEKIRKDLIHLVHLYGGEFGMIDANTSVEKAITWLEKQGEIDNCPLESSTNTVITDSKKNQVEPKFKADDWINGYYTNYKVLSVNNEGYVVEDVDGNKINILFENEKFHHLWTIQDAKDGDVLVAPPINGSEHSEQIFIFKEIKDRDHVKNAVEYYCRYMDNEFVLNEWGFMGQSDDYFIPATKEQRDLLFQKMIEAGYEWDEENKELKKIEQKPAWGEGDEMIALSIEQVMNCASLLNIVPYKIDKIRTWLKSLKDKYTWKPDEEQLKAIKWIMDGDNPENWTVTLTKLYNDLKKL